MKFKGLLVASILTLNSCASAQMNVQNAAQKERDAWARLQQNSDQVCGHHDDTNPLPREKAIEKTACWAKIAETDVLPNVLFPEVANKYLLALKQIALDYQNVKIDRDQAKLNQEKAWNDYNTELNNRYRESMRLAHETDMITQQQQAQNSQAFLGMLQQQELMRQQQAAQSAAVMQQMPKQTNCTTFKNSLNCTTW